MGAHCKVTSVELMEHKIRAHYTVVIEHGPIAAGATFIPLEDIDGDAVQRVFSSIEKAINIGHGLDVPDDEDIGGVLDNPDADIEDPL